MLRSQLSFSLCGHSRQPRSRGEPAPVGFWIPECPMDSRIDRRGSAGPGEQVPAALGVG